jgi:hypothetical protein
VWVAARFWPIWAKSSSEHELSSSVDLLFFRHQPVANYITLARKSIRRHLVLLKTQRTPFAIRHSPFAIRHSPFAIRHSLFARIIRASQFPRNLPILFRHAQSGL